MSYQSLFSFDSITLPNNIFYAPLAGCSDLPFRKICAKYRPGLFFCEMVKMEALIRNDANTYRLLDYEKDMHPIGAQICGSNPKIAKDVARKIEDLGFDVVDLNCGCPVDKVTKDGSGSGMLKNPDLIGEVLLEMKKGVRIPVTVKIRKGWDDHHVNAEQITQIAENVGATAITIHGRTRKQGYKGDADWEIIKACKQRAKKILVIGNGDVFEPEDAKSMLEKTQCDGVLVSRGCLGKPWIAEDIKELLKEGTQKSTSFDRIKKNLIEHLEYILCYKTGKKANNDFKRVCNWYLKSYKLLRKKIDFSMDLLDIIHFLEKVDYAYSCAS